MKTAAINLNLAELMVVLAAIEVSKDATPHGRLLRATVKKLEAALKELDPKTHKVWTDADNIH